VITIGQLARYVGVSTKTIRVYQDKGLLPEPERDASGYRRYSAQDAADLIKIRTLAVAGVPLSRIRDLVTAPPDAFREALTSIDHDLTARITRLRDTQLRLRALATGQSQLVPNEVDEYLNQLRDLGFSEAWVTLQADLWLLVFVTNPDTAPLLFHDQADAVADPDLRQIFLAYDRAHDLEPDDPALEELAGQIVDATTHRYDADRPLPGQVADSPLPALIQETVNAASPAWRRLDSLVRRELKHRLQ